MVSKVVTATVSVPVTTIPEAVRHRTVKAVSSEDSVIAKSLPDYLLQKNATLLNCMVRNYQLGEPIHHLL